MVGVNYIGEWRLVGEGKIHRKGREEREGGFHAIGCFRVNLVNYSCAALNQMLKNI